MLDILNYENDKIKVVGRAGTGKTTTLKNIYDILRINKIPMENIGMVTYTKNAANEFRERISEENKNIRTMHSMCFNILELQMNENTITKKDNISFMNEYYDKDYSENEKIDDTDWEFYKTAIDHVDIYRNGLLDFNKYYIPEKIFKINDMPRCLDVNTTREICNNWLNYMKIHDKYDFTRLLEEVYTNKLRPSFSHMFFDEFQDFTPLQYQIFLDWQNHIDNIYIAGDDCQTIYGFIGANAKHFINTDYKEIILNKTYRHGPAIFNNAQRYINRINNKIYADVKPNGTKSVVKRSNTFKDYVPFDTTFLLATTEYWAKKMRDMFYKEHKIMPLSIGSNTLENVEIAYKGLSDLYKNKKITDEEVKIILKLLPTKIEEIQQTLTNEPNTKVKKIKLLKFGVKKQLADKNLKIPSEVDIHEFLKFFDNPKISIETIVKHIKNIELLGEYIFPQIAKPHNVKFGTIHAAKGMEADTVFLGSSVSYFDVMAIKESNDMDKFKDAEDDVLRLFYVGASRAKKLHVDFVDNLFTYNGKPSTQIDELFYGI